MPAAKDIQHLLEQNQDPDAVRDVCEKVETILASDEAIQFIALQKRLSTPLPAAVVVTDRRFIVCSPRLLGRIRFEDHPWRALGEPELDEGVLGATFHTLVGDGSRLSVPHLPRTQARRLYGLVRERLENVRRQHRDDVLEEKRAAAGTASPAPEVLGDPGRNDPKERLRRLDAMRHEGLLRPEEYEAKRAEILEAM